MIEINGTKKRNLQEQVLKNKEDIEDLKSGVTSPAFEDITGDPSDNALLNAALNNKVDKVTGKGLSTNDFTNADKTKLDGIDLSTKQDALTTAQLEAVNSGMTASDVTAIGALITQMLTKSPIIEAGLNITLTTLASGHIQISSTGGSGGTWGSITGSISNQTDLWNELNSKLNATAITAYRTAGNQDVIDVDLRNLITSETTRATNAEATLQTNINNCLTAAKLVEGSNIDITTSGSNVIISCSIEAMEFKGSVATYADLPSGAANGDTYIVQSNYKVYTKTASGWVQSGNAFDTGNFYTKTECDDRFALKSNPTFTGTANLADANVSGEMTLDKGAKFTAGAGAELDVQCDASFSGSKFEIDDSTVVTGLVKSLGNEAVSGEPYKFGYYFSITPSANNIVVTEYTITLDNNKSLAQYTLTVPAATSSTAGLMTASDKTKLDGLSGVEANPTGEATQSMSKLKVGSIIYNFDYYTKSEIDTKLTDGTVTKLGTSTIGTSKKGIYWKDGVPTVMNGNVGNSTLPVYLNNGEITAGVAYGGGTKVNVNGTEYPATNAFIYCPTSAGTQYQHIEADANGYAQWVTDTKYSGNIQDKNNAYVSGLSTNVKLNDLLPMEKEAGTDTTNINRVRLFQNQWSIPAGTTKTLQVGRTGIITFKRGNTAYMGMWTTWDSSLTEIINTIGGSDQFTVSFTPSTNTLTVTNNSSQSTASMVGIVITVTE